MNFFICAVITALCGPSQSTAAGRTWSMLLWYTWYRFMSSHNHNFQTNLQRSYSLHVRLPHRILRSTILCSAPSHI
ncbi:hypothetical protein PF004_g7003 [Phytophthora fragariae]|uniref:RxLR effector protein n=1 Tax=Phytophthora fragariae TaxID=53985 RepID=A0A6G0PB28_9STRA|nr:hypothetical protein PF004_g7003 [Phytophthora fragariae]